MPVPTDCSAGDSSQSSRRCSTSTPSTRAYGQPPTSDRAAYEPRSEHSLHTRAIGSPLAVASSRPLGLNARSLTRDPWVSEDDTGRPELASHNHAVPSSLAVAISPPSGLNRAA